MAIKTEGADTAEMLKKGEQRRIRNMGFYDFSTAAGGNHCHSPMNSLKNIEQFQDPALFPTRIQGFNRSTLLEPFEAKVHPRENPRNPRTASMAKRGAIRRAEKSPFMQNLPTR